MLLRVAPTLPLVGVGVLQGVLLRYAATLLGDLPLPVVATLPPLPLAVGVPCSTLACSCARSSCLAARFRHASPRFHLRLRLLREPRRVFRHRCHSRNSGDYCHRFGFLQPQQTITAIPSKLRIMRHLCTEKRLASGLDGAVCPATLVSVRVTHDIFLSQRQDLTFEHIVWALRPVRSSTATTPTENTHPDLVLALPMICSKD